MTRLLLLAASATSLALLGGCGKRGDLHPAEGHSLPPKPAMAASQPTAAELLTPPTTARPPRSDELLLQSEERPDDRFNMPPRD